MLDECTVRAVRKIRRPNIHDGRLLITYSINLVELGNVHEACMVSLVHGCMVSLVYGHLGVWVYGQLGAWVYGQLGAWGVYGQLGNGHGACMVKHGSVKALC